MYALRRNGSRLYRFIAEQILGITSITASAAFLAMIALAIFGFACNSPTPTEPIHGREITLAPTNGPTPTATPAPTPTPKPTLVPAVTLEEPEDGLCFGCGSEVVLRWSCPRELQAGEFSRVRLRSKRQDSFTYHKEDYYPLIDPPPGEYDWAVAMVRATDQGEYVLLNEESTWYGFEIVPPPVVHSISPTCTVQGTGVTVVVSGENLTRSLAFTIGVPLKATFVNSSTITATIPITLEVGKYDVTVKDPVGQGDSYASFVVSLPAPLPTQPASSPWNPAIPVPTALPGYNPSVACVINPCAPAPQLIDPQDDTKFTVNSSIELRWEWAYCLPPEWKFAIRVSETSPPHSCRYEDDPKFISCENGKAVGRYRLPKDSRFRTTSGTYYWNVAVARPAEGGEGRWERLSEESEIRSLTVKPAEGDDEPDRP